MLYNSCLLYYMLLNISCFSSIVFQNIYSRYAVKVEPSTLRSNCDPRTLGETLRWGHCRNFYSLTLYTVWQLLAKEKGIFILDLTIIYLASCIYKILATFTLTKNVHCKTVDLKRVTSFR